MSYVSANCIGTNEQADGACVGQRHFHAGRALNVWPEEDGEFRALVRVVDASVESYRLFQARGDVAVRPRFAPLFASVLRHDGASFVAEGVFRIDDMPAPSLGSVRADKLVGAMFFGKTGATEVWMPFS